MIKVRLIPQDFYGNEGFEWFAIDSYYQPLHHDITKNSSLQTWYIETELPCLPQQGSCIEFFDNDADLYNQLEKQLPKCDRLKKLLEDWAKSEDIEGPIETILRKFTTSNETANIYADSWEVKGQIGFIPGCEYVYIPIQASY